MIGDIWLGDRESHAMFIEKQKLADNPEWLASMRMSYDSEQARREPEAYESRLITKHGTTALLMVEGDLVNQNSWMNEYLGRVSYEEIQEALTEAGEDNSVEQIVMAYSTGGGTASGIKPCGDYIHHIDTNVKPVYSFTATAAFSAGYWLYSEARKGYVESMAQLGSIGAIQIHVSYKEALDKEGIKYTVFREGVNKALGHPSEELSDSDKAEFQAKLKKANDFFLTAVMQNRNVTLSNQNAWGEGNTYFGQDAISVGLADEITTLHALLGTFTQQSGNGRAQFGGDMPKVKLDATQKTPATPEAAAKAPDTEAAIADLNPALQENLTDAELATIEAEAMLKLENPEPVLEDKAPEISLEGATLLAKDAELATLQASLTESTALAETLQAQLDASTELTGRMKDIVLASANAKLIAMGGTAMDMDFLDVNMAMQHFDKVQAKFASTFKAGRVSNQQDLKKPADELQLGAAPTAMERAAFRKN